MFIPVKEKKILDIIDQMPLLSYATQTEKIRIIESVLNRFRNVRRKRGNQKNKNARITFILESGFRQRIEEFIFIVVIVRTISKNKKKMCEYLQRKFDWPVSGIHSCYNKDCKNTVDCHPNNSTFCAECHLTKHMEMCRICGKHVVLAKKAANLLLPDEAMQPVRVFNW